MAPTVDLNADLGEGFGRWSLTDDDALLAVVTSANVACGFHAGDPLTMRSVCTAAVEHGVAIGAQVGYRDLAGFGRRVIEYDPAELAADVLYQLAALDGIARASGDRVRYVKPHGALYNRAADDPVQAGAVVAAVVDYDRSLPVLCLPGSVLATAASDAGLRVVGEAFCDRGYTSAGRLVPRSSPGALVSGVETVAARAVRFAVERATDSVDGALVPVDADSICVHGDSPGAVAVAERVRAALTEAGVRLAAFA
jgi:5-oxoprolinase (ATP-hydrolysing) subunit A